MSDLTIALPAGFYRLGGFNDNGIDVYHNGSDGFSTEFGSFTNFDRLNENVNPFNPSLYHKKMEELVNSSLPRTPLSDRTNAENGVLSARLNRSRDGLEWTVWITPHWNTPKLSPGRTATSYLLEVLSPRTPPSSPPSIPKSFTVLNIEEIPIWIDTPDTPMTPTEQRDFFEPSNSPYSSPPLPSVRSSSFDLQLHDPPLRDPHVFLQPHDPNAHWTLCSVHPPRPPPLVPFVVTAAFLGLAPGTSKPQFQLIAHYRRLYHHVLFRIVRLSNTLV
ncbi:uncharacterized protein CcaverHIS019_0402660 [Cutaneotrichosporon cavernicola]|uniref:Uncharacterized protein n=1 Tax=Cutaneotrichosporon cavernicola TaxID=279322 RepID=A0AA48L3S8_9TREE|nr:uncharacterized protein CcaverHIS019_0402660 [Cutaneotrichosporon cavernicola]BEI91446.1 hypothetical protein CcaverHIS019_0402660 [Cutaneotrichosporon cavernicola]